MDIQPWIYKIPESHVRPLDELKQGIYVFDFSERGPNVSLDGCVRICGLHWNDQSYTWGLEIGPTSIFDYKTMSYKFVDKDGWEQMNWLNILVTTGYTEQKMSETLNQLCRPR